MQVGNGGPGASMASWAARGLGHKASPPRRPPTRRFEYHGLLAEPQQSSEGAGEGEGKENTNSEQHEAAAPAAPAAR